MEQIIIHPDNVEQSKIIKDLNVQNESHASIFPLHVLKGIEESIAQHEGGQTISLQEFKERHLSK